MMLVICPWLQVTWLTTTTTTTWSNVTWRLHEIVTLLDKWCDLQVPNNFTIFVKPRAHGRSNCVFFHNVSEFSRLNRVWRTCQRRERQSNTILSTRKRSEIVLSTYLKKLSIVNPGILCKSFATLWFISIGTSIQGR